MENKIDTLLDRIGDTYKSQIAPDARHYMEVSIGLKAREMGFEELYEPLRDAYAVVPLKAPVPGMKVRIDGRTFVNYRRHRTGIAIPGYVAKTAGQAFDPFVPNDSMILNCT